LAADDYNRHWDGSDCSVYSSKQHGLIELVFGCMPIGDQDGQRYVMPSYHTQP
jgi:hypothetical protein